MSIWSTRPVTTTVPAPDNRAGIRLEVGSLAETIPFYRHFLDTEPAYQDAEQACFEADDPVLLVTLVKASDPVPAKGHFGLQMKNTRFVEEASERLQTHGFKLINEDDVACCYAVQSKVWAADPEGNRWELFVTTESDADEGCGPDCICHAEFERSFAS